MCFAFIRQSREWTLSSRSPPPTPRRTHECRYVYCVSQEKRTHTTCTSHPDFWCFASGDALPREAPPCLGWWWWCLVVPCLGWRLLASDGGGAWWFLSSGGRGAWPKVVVVPCLWEWSCLCLGWWW